MWSHVKFKSVRQWCILSLILSSFSAWANTETIVTALDGQNPYMVVVRDDEGGSKREPGIYFPDLLGKWNLLIAGDVLTGGANQGILAQLFLSKIDQRYASLAVVNGKLKLFQMNPQKVDEQSVITIGEGEGEASDIFGTPVSLPHINNIQDITVLQRELPHRSATGQTVLISIRSVSQGLHGDGVTLAFHVKKGMLEDPSKIQISNAPMVLDYQFHSYEKLHVLTDTSDPETVLSTLAIQSALRNAKKDDSRVVTAWRDRVKKKLLAFSHSLASGSDLTELPVINITTGKVELEDSPSSSLSLGNTMIMQHYDVLQGHDELVFPGRLRVKGSVNPVFNVGHRDYHFYNSYDAMGHALVYINSELYFVMSRGGDTEPGLIKLEGRTGNLPEKASFVSKSIKKDLPSGNVEHYLFFSYVNEGEKKTVAYVVHQYSSGALLLDRKLDILEKFLMEEELSERVNFKEYIDVNKEVLFDDFTPVQNSGYGYKQVFVPTSPLLNVSQSSSQRLVQTFIKALEEKALEGSVGIYKLFESSGARENQSGLYVFGSSKNELESFKGELLSRSLVQNFGVGSTDFSVELFSREVSFSELKIPLKIFIIAIDSSFRGGNSGFKLVTLVSTSVDKSHKYYFEPKAFETNISLPFTGLSSCQVIYTGKKGGDQFITLATFKSPDIALSPMSSGKWKPKGGVFSKVWKLDVDSGEMGSSTQVKIVQAKEHWLSNEKVEGSVVNSRIRMDIEGNLYWLNNPGKDENDPKYQLVQLITGQSVFPNAPNGMRVQLLSELDTRKELYESSDGDTQFNGSRSYFSKWRIFAKRDISRILGMSNESFYSFESGSKLFPKLEDQLNQLADSNLLPKHEVFLVSDEMVSDFWNTVLYWMVQEKVKKSHFHMDNSEVAFHGISPNISSQGDILQALAIAREPFFGEKRSVLLGSVHTVNSIGVPTFDSKKDALLLKDLDGKPRVSPSLPYLLASEGKKIEFEDYAKGLVSPSQVSMVLVSTPDQWSQFKKSHQGLLRTNGVLDSFHLNKKYLSGSWKLWNPKSSLATSEVKQYSDQPVSESEKDVFPNLSTTLFDLADLKKKPKHKVLLVSRELKPLVKKMIMARWASDRVEESIWSYKNPKLELYKFDPSRNVQSVVFQNFDAMIGDQSDRRTVLIAEVQDVIRSGRPTGTSSGDAFMISDWVKGEGISSLDGMTKSQKFEGEQPQLPHLLYLFETEGKKMPLADFSKTEADDKKVSILMIGEPAEWENLKKDLTLEARLNLAQRFESFELQTPTPKTRRDILVQVANSPEIQRLGYRFDAKDLVQSSSFLSSAEASEKLLSYLVSRSETLAQQSSQETTTAFIKVLTSFRRALIEDPYLRKAKIINKSYLERLLTRIFSIPLNLNILTPDDPYKQLSHDRAPLRLQEAGYRGPLELKAQVISTLLAPTWNDPTKAIPGSIIVFGDTSTGKTMLFSTVMKMLNLKEYQFNNPHDEEASYMTINVGRLTAEKSSSSPEVMTIDECLKHINNFLSLPNGYRGHILFDDMHKGGKEVVGLLMKFLSSMFEAEKGLLRVERIDSQSGVSRVVEIPVRNIHPWITLNPTQDQQKLERYCKNKEKNDVDIVVATLSTDEYPVEKSFLARWGLVLNVSKFPLDAKAPALSDSLRGNARSDFNVQGRLVLVSPVAVNQIVQAFPDSNARAFLSAATSQLLQIPNDSKEKGSLFLVVPANEATTNSLANSQRSFGGWEATGRDNGKIEDYIRSSMVSVPVDNRIYGKLHLLSLMVDSYRTSVYESLVEAMSQHEQFAGSRERTHGVLAPMLLAITSNFISNSYLQLKRIKNLDPADFIASNSKVFDFIERKLQQAEFYKIVNAMPDELSSLSDVPFRTRLNPTETWNSFMDERSDYFVDRTRYTVVSEMTGKVNQVLTEYLNQIARVNSVYRLPTSEEWLDALKDTDQKEEFFSLGSRLADLYLEFWSSMYDMQLVENRTSVNDYRPGIYDIARLFTLVIDQAISKMPWGTMTKFMLKNLTLTTSDMEIGQRFGVQHYLFVSKNSLLKPATHELLLQMTTGSQSYKYLGDRRRQEYETQFLENISNMFVPVSSSSSPGPVQKDAI